MSTLTVGFSGMQPDLRKSDLRKVQIIVGQKYRTFLTISLIKIGQDNLIRRFLKLWNVCSLKKREKA